MENELGTDVGCHQNFVDWNSDVATVLKMSELSQRVREMPREGQNPQK